MDNKNTEVGNRIERLRHSRGYTREKLSELAEISVQFIADIEKGKKTMTVPVLRRIARALSASTDYIVNGTDDLDNSVEIYDMIKSLSPQNRTQAIQILNVFIEAVNGNKNNTINK